MSECNRRLKWRLNSPSCKMHFAYVIDGADIWLRAIVHPTPVKWVGGGYGTKDRDEVEILGNRDNDYHRVSPKSGKAKVAKLMIRREMLKDNIRLSNISLQHIRERLQTEKYSVSSYSEKLREDQDELSKIRRVIMSCWDFEVDYWIMRLGQLTREVYKLREEIGYCEKGIVELESNKTYYLDDISHYESELQRVEPRLPWKDQEKNKSKAAYHDYFTQLGKMWAADRKAAWKAAIAE